MPGKEVYEIEAVPVHTGGGMDEAEPGTVLGTVVGGPSTTLNSLAAGYGGDGEAGWQPAPARRRSAATLGITLCAGVTLLIVATVAGTAAVSTFERQEEDSSAKLASAGYVSGDGGQHERPPPSPPPPQPEFAVTLNEDIAAIPAGSDARRSFERRFVADLAASLAISADKIRVTGITAGSITVSFEVLDPPTNLDVIGVLIVRRPALAGADFQAAVELSSTDGIAAADQASCTSRRSCAALAMPDMVAQRTTYSWLDIETSSNLVRLGDWVHPSNSWPADDGYVTVPLQFEFRFYGMVERTVSIGTNGYLTFGEMAHYPFGNTLVIPTPGGDIGGETVDGLVAVMWTDLDPSAGGAVFHQGNSAQQIVTWHTVPYFNSNRTIASNSVGSTFQAIIYASGDMIMQYLLRPLYMEYLYVEFVCKCIHVYFTYILDGAGTSQSTGRIYRQKATITRRLPSALKITMDRKVLSWPTDGLSYQQMRLRGWSARVWLDGSQTVPSIPLIHRESAANLTWSHISSPVVLHPEASRSIPEGAAMDTMIL